ncbi:2-polyprenyl-3-methyl-5-hydroxy-6-metoxy-1,4-benzoquinol methylase [Neorhizobium galegae]|uniref:class I SAM-dependent methyltransferase n=1 Tax=Neorhizobium galegae TaxID=399 RepID=UPI001AE8612F|nr:class I SAM-dependent methyltransferase [Neorhizobium galegae]MBP2549475.1 2-polyprenyl-3-methyl-5-hydroxy-6-metoxy-1,4-benzoquinol methylase [Neorhizobium galegae]
MTDRIVSGTVKADGSVLQGQGFQVSRKAAGRYLLVFQPPLNDVAGGMTQLSGADNARGCRANVLSVDGLHASIAIRNDQGRDCDCDFSFLFSGSMHAITPPRPALGTPAGSESMPDLAIGSPSPTPPVVSFPLTERVRRAMTPDPLPEPAPPERPVDPLISAQQSQIDRLKQMTQQVLQRLQVENRMLKAKLHLRDQAPEPSVPPIGVTPQFVAIPGGPALARLLVQENFDSVLDYGPGWQKRTRLLAEAGKTVTVLVPAAEPLDRTPGVSIRHDGIQSENFGGPFDCILMSHVLQRTPDPQRFLRRLHALLPEGGVLALAVPALSFPMVNGDLSIWSAGLLLQHLVLAGFDCRDAAVLTEGDEICLVLRKSSIQPVAMDADLPSLDSLRAFLPARLDFISEPEGCCFNGDIRNLNW